MRKIYFFSLLLCLASIIHAQSVNDLFSSQNELSRNFHTLASKYQALQLNTAKLANLKSQQPVELTLSLPFEGTVLTLELKKAKITSDNFSVIEALPGGGRRTVSYADAVFYQGKIQGSSSSIATISLVGDQVMGVISDSRGNIVLGAVQDNGNATSEYALYREADLQKSNPLACFTDDETAPAGNAVRPSASSTGRLDFVGAPVDMYFECDFRMYQDKGSNTINVINYVLGFFNNTALLYANENVQIQVSQILVWTTQDPEAAAGLNSTSAVLNAFSTRMAGTTYIGDYAHFLSTRSLGGGIAWLTGTCPTRFNRAAVSAIDNTYANFPLFSWTVEVVTHEIGHNLGSHHTHWCGWPGGPIDGCGPTANAGYAEGTCSTGPIPVSQGSIMSYCHLLGGVGINLSNGFGPLPGQAIRDFVTASNCLNTCIMTISLTKQDASCGQNNGTAAVTATNANGALTYLWSNGQTGSSLVNAAPGTYHVTVTDAGGC
ncbi:MAG: M12 family metallo-peptidase, partial [Chitinophagaceae bacterium]